MHSHPHAEHVRIPDLLHMNLAGASWVTTKSRFQYDVVRICLYIHSQRDISFQEDGELVVLDYAQFVRDKYIAPARLHTSNNPRISYSFDAFQHKSFDVV